jgi:nucleoid DNA-binding protein
MFDLLYQYLVRNNRVSLPGLGTFFVEQVPAKIDIVNKSIVAPSYTFRLDRANDFSGKNFFVWLANAAHISEWDAIKKLSEFAFEVRKAIQQGNKVIWKGVGVLRPGQPGEIKFEPEKKNFVFEQQVVAEKVIRENADHRMLVGDKEKTSSQMTRILAMPPVQIPSSFAPTWWAISIVVAFASIMLIGWHFSEYGLGVTSTGAIKKLKPIEAPATYKSLQ